MKQFQLVLFLEKSEMQREPRVTPAGTPSTVIAVAAYGTVFAWTAAISIKVGIANVIDRAVSLIIQRMHLHRRNVTLFLVAFKANIEILCKQEKTKRGMSNLGVSNEKGTNVLQKHLPC